MHTVVIAGGLLVEIKKRGNARGQLKSVRKQQHVQGCSGLACSLGGNPVQTRPALRHHYHFCGCDFRKAFAVTAIAGVLHSMWRNTAWKSGFIGRDGRR